MCGIYIGEYPWKLTTLYTLAFSVYSDSHGIKIKAILIERKPEQDTLLGIILCSLIIRIKDEVAERIEDGFTVSSFTDKLIIHGHVGVVCHDNIGTHIKEFKIFISCIGTWKSGKLLTCMGYNYTPSVI